MAGLSLCAALALVALAVVALIDRPGDEPCCAPPPVPRANPAGAVAALHDLVGAVDERDEQAAAGLAPVGDRQAASLLSAVARNARVLDLRDVSARYVTEVGTVDRSGAWSAVVAVTWRIGGFDDTRARSEVVVSFAPDRGHRASRGSVAITGFGGEAVPGRRTPLWLQGGLAVVRMSGPRVLVLAHGPRSTARATADRVRRGIRVVRRTLPGWADATVVEVPRGAAALDETLGVRPGTYADIAAVTAAVDGTARRRTPVHVFVNPEVSDGLRPAGAQVVMSHELTHLATDAVRSTVEPWLLEGFADWVALRQVRLPETLTLGRALASVRRDGVPARLPGRAELDTRAADLQAAYEQAWLACRILAERVGADALVRLYQRVDAGAPLAVELRRAGLSEPALLRAWQRRLRDLAG